MPPIFKMLKDTISIDYPSMLNFCLSNPYITTVDVGAQYVEEFELDIRTALGPGMSEEERENLKHEADKISKHLHSICRECMHCQEKFSCSQDLDFPSILALYSRYMIAEKLGKDTTFYKEQYKKIQLDAESCIECGECVPWCDYELNIPEMLKKAHEVLSS